MVITSTKLTSGVSTANASAYGTNSFTPSANQLILVGVVNSDATSAITPTISGNGLVWVQIGTYPVNDSEVRTTLFRSLGATPSAGSIVIDFAGDAQTGAAWSIVQFSGVNLGGVNGGSAIVQNITGSSATGTTSFSVTLGTFETSTNGTYGIIGLKNAAIITSGANFSELDRVGYATPGTELQSEFFAGSDTTVNWTWDNSAKGAAVAVEIREFIASAAANNSYGYSDGFVSISQYL